MGPARATSGLPTTLAQDLAHPYFESIAFAQRAGVLRTQRQASVLTLSEGNRLLHEQGLSMARAFTGPRPVALPPQRQCHGALSRQPGLDVTNGIADVAFVPQLPLEAAGKRTWWPTRFTLASPPQGLLRAGWNGEFEIACEQQLIEGLGSPLRRDDPTPYAWRASLVFGGASHTLAVRDEAPSAPGQPRRLRLAPGAPLPFPAQTDEVRGTVLLTLAPVLGSASPVPAEPAVTLVFPVVALPAQNFGLPMVARTVTFFDPVFDDALGSEVAASGTDPQVARLLLDRLAYNTTGALVVMLSLGSGALALERWRRDARTGVIQAQPLELAAGARTVPLEMKRPLRVALSTLRAAAGANAGDVLQAGDMLRASAVVEGKELAVVVPISATPVLPPPEAAYALWRLPGAGQPPGPVTCPMYGLGVMPDRVDLVDPVADLLAGRVRRRALFRWQVVQPAWEAEGTFFVQRIDHAGATHFPAPPQGARTARKPRPAAKPRASGRSRPKAVKEGSSTHR